jgi:hypothetical protein
MQRKSQPRAKPVSNAERHRRAQQLVNAAVTQHAEEWSVLIGLTPKDERISQFREDVTWALDMCIRTHIFVGQHRPSDMRKYFRELHDAYIAAAKKLREAQAIRDRLPLPLYHEFRLAPAPLPMEHLEARAEAARLHAEEWKHGHPPSKPAFNALAKGLVLAFRRATGRSGVGYGAREGKLLDFVKSVLSVVLEFDGVVMGKPLETPGSPEALGEYLHYVASATD